MVEFSKRVPADGTDAVGVILNSASDPNVISFAGGLPAGELFPIKEMEKATDEAYEKHGEAAMQYGSASGVVELRKQLLKRSEEKENIKAELKNIMMTTGSEQALDLMGKTFINPGDAVLLEEPTYLCAVDVFRSYGAEFVGVEMDDNGMRTDKLEEALKAHPEAKLIYTIPNYQNPSGRTMSLERRKKVAELAAKYDVYVLEDNPYGDIRFAGEEHIPSIKSFDTTDHVVYTSTFSKILAPGFRLGWVIANDYLIKKLTVMKQSADLQTDNLVQYACSAFLKNNDIDAHIKEISKVYSERKDRMVEDIKKYFPKGVQCTNPHGGMFLWVTVPGVEDTVELFKQCLKHNVAFVPGDPFFGTNPVPGTFRLNYSCMPIDKIDEGIQRLGKALQEAIEN
ncbi:PLP-dependent aminotransferase family protein [Limosilactobacillus secaliphilus]|uniref:2-aminoadipate transaminase n=1 Tax=Limosilactobacillus secaliphilus TaxID=396268 RepID=A0A0R2IAH4_9LACO|nr:PLP-dependent aminotransferase family protein [Limosilactobacillus secaliphilus]KRN58954.1 2-aminoadipate transaminase [Limosilactobacillus secaliphilus]